MEDRLVVENATQESGRRDGAADGNISMWGNFKRIVFILGEKPRKQLAQVFVLMLIAAVLEMVGVGFILPLLQIVTEPDKVAEMAIIGDLYNRLTPNEPRLFLVLFTAAMAVFYVFRNVFVLGVTYIQTRFVMRTQAEQLIRLFDFYMRRPYTFQLERNSAVILRNLEVAVPSVFVGGLLPLMTLGLELCLALGTLSVLLFVEPLGTLVAGVVLAAASFVIYRLLGPHQREWGVHLQDFAAAIYKWIHQGLGANKEARVMGREPFFRGQVAEHALGRTHYQIRVKLAGQIPRLVLESILMIAVLLIVTLMVFVQEQSLATIVPTLGVFAVGAFRLMPSANRMVLAAGSLKGGMAAVNLVYDDICEGGTKREETSTDGVAAEPLRFETAIRLEDLHYRYPTAAEDALRGLDMTIARGETVALVGPSGAGKTTFVDVILGLLEPTRGRISVDGTDIAAQPRRWQDRVGYVPQTIYLLDDTLRQNVAFGVPDDRIDEPRLERALRLAHLEGVVANLSEKAYTHLGEHGVRLSGGQRQRVGIARALYNDPDVLILDEATAALDNETEREVTRAIEELSGEKTLLVIAHRLSTVRHCDRVIFLQDGQASDIGTFDELLSRNPAFRKFAQTGDMGSGKMTLSGEIG